MKTKIIYYIILLVYIFLWTCELVVCHMTHSLIILTDSYINLYKILDISLGLVHLSTQQKLTKNQLFEESSDKPREPIRLLDSLCTYQFKRLPLLGNFINGLFLAALLMSAAIEGIQTCVHSRHSEGDISILHKDRLTFPVILAGFTLVSLIMQHCSLKVHELREEELQSDSFLDIRQQSATNSQLQPRYVKIKELSANDLHHQDYRLSSGKRKSYNLNPADGKTTNIPDNRMQDRNFSLQELRKSSSEDRIPNNRDNCISLRSLKFSTDLESIVQPVGKDIGTISSDLEAPPQIVGKISSKKDNWFLVRFIASPLTMLVYGACNYYINDDILVEIFDATLSVCVVILLFAASYPPMIRAGRVLLQTVPDGVDLVRLQQDLMGISDCILEVKDLHVWSLTPRSNRVATCQLVLDKDRICNDKEIKFLLCEARYKFLDQNIKRTTIEPLLRDREVKNSI